MSDTQTQVLYHPAFPDTAKEIEGADLIQKYIEGGWLTEQPAAEQPVAAPAPAPAPSPAPAPAGAPVPPAAPAAPFPTASAE